MRKKLIPPGVLYARADFRLAFLVDRAAIAEHEKKLGWPATGHAGKKIYKALKGD